MSVYKHIRKRMLKGLSKDQRKQFLGFMQDIHDTLLFSYSEAIRTNSKGSSETYFLPVDETKVMLEVSIETIDRF